MTSISFAPMDVAPTLGSLVTLKANQHPEINVVPFWGAKSEAEVGREGA